MVVDVLVPVVLLVLLPVVDDVDVPVVLDVLVPVVLLVLVDVEVVDVELVLDVLDVVELVLLVDVELVLVVLVVVPQLVVAMDSVDGTNPEKNAPFNPQVLQSAGSESPLMNVFVRLAVSDDTQSGNADNE